MQVWHQHVQTTEFPCSSGAAHHPTSRSPGEQRRREWGMWKERRRGLLARRRAGNVHWVWNRAKATLIAHTPQKKEMERDGREERTIMASRRREWGWFQVDISAVCLSNVLNDICPIFHLFIPFFLCQVVDGALCLSSYRQSPVSLSDTSHSLSPGFSCSFPLSSAQSRFDPFAGLFNSSWFVFIAITWSR